MRICFGSLWKRNLKYFSALNNSWSIRNPVDCFLRQLYIIDMYQIYRQLKVLAMMSFIQFRMRNSFNVFPIKKAVFGNSNKLSALFYFIITQLYIDHSWNECPTLRFLIMNTLKTIPCDDWHKIMPSGVLGNLLHGPNRLFLPKKKQQLNAPSSLILFFGGWRGEKKH